MAVYFEVADTTLILKSLQIIARNACLAESGEAWVKKKQQREIYTEEKKQRKEKSKKSPGLYTTGGLFTSRGLHTTGLIAWRYATDYM